MKRCDWATKHALETHYHDTEWGVPSYDDHYLFKMLVQSLKACKLASAG